MRRDATTAASIWHDEAMKHIEWLDVDIGDADELVTVATYKDEYIVAAVATIRTPSGFWLVAERMAGRGEDEKKLQPGTEKGVQSLHAKLTQPGSRWTVLSGDDGIATLAEMAAAMPPAPPSED